MRLKLFSFPFVKDIWELDVCLLFPRFLFLYKQDIPFQGEYYTSELSFPTSIIVDFSKCKCYAELRLLGFGISFHFYKINQRREDATQ